MQIQILTVGKIKEKYVSAAIAEYLKRLSGYAKVEVQEIKDEKTPDNAFPAEEALILEKESARLEALIKPQTYLIALAIEGRQFTSPEFARHLDNLATSGKSHLTFLIGGSLGLSPALLKKADLLLSFSTLTFPHQLFRDMLRSSNVVQENLAPVLIAFFISTSVVNSILYVVRRAPFSKHKLCIKTAKFISKVHHFLYLMLGLILMDILPSFTLELTLVHLFILLTIMIIIYMVIMTPISKSTVSEFGEGIHSIQDALIEQYRKEYSKINKKRHKKNKKPLTQSEMVKQLRVESKIICNPALFALSLGMFLFSAWILLNHNNQIISIIFVIISSLILFFHISIFTFKKDIYKLIRLFESEDIKLEPFKAMGEPMGV